MNPRAVAAVVLLLAAAPAQTPALRRVGSFDVGPGGNVHNLAFSDDGKSLAAASGAEVLVWDVASGAERARVVPGPGSVFVALSPDGTQLGTANDDGEVRVTALASGERLFQSNVGMGTLGWSPDGRLLAVHLHKPGLVLLDANDFTPHATLVLERSNELLQWAFSADGREVTALQSQLGLFVWNVATGERRVIARGAFTGAAPAADGRWQVTHERGVTLEPADGIVDLGVASKLFLARRSGHLALQHGRSLRWRDQDGEQLCELRSSDAAALHPDGDLLAIARGDRVELRERNGAIVRELRGHRCEPDDVVVTSDGQRVLALRPEERPGTAEPSVFVYDVGSGATAAVQLDPAPRRMLAVPGQPDVLFAGQHRLQLWHPVLRSVIRSVEVPPRGIVPVWSPDGCLVWPGGMFGRKPSTEVFDLDRSAWLEIPTPDGSWPLAWSRDRRRLLLQRVFGGHGNLPTPLYLTVDGVVAARASVSGGCWTASWSANGDLVAVATISRTVVLDGATLVERASGPRSRWVRFIDDHHVVTSADNRVVVWRADSGEVVCSEVLRAGADRSWWIWYDVGMLAGDASPDGRTIAAADQLGVHVFRFER